MNEKSYCDCTYSRGHRTKRQEVILFSFKRFVMTTESKLVAHKVHSYSEAIEAIESGDYSFVELDYNMSTAQPREAMYLFQLGSKNKVSVLHLAQMAVTVKSLSVLERNLLKSKDTYKQRFINLEFDLSFEELEKYQVLASEMGDMIIPKALGMEPMASEVWS